MNIKVLLTAASVLAFGLQALAQGCSDAGLCTLGSMKPERNSEHRARVNKLGLSSFVAQAEERIFVYGFNLEYSRQFAPELSLEAKLSTLGHQQKEKAISTFGLADLSVALSYQVAKPLTLMLGMKAPLSHCPSVGRDAHPLPLAYQASLGTWDLLAGLSYRLANWQIGAGYQQALSKSYTAPLYERQGDLLLRASYALELGAKWRFSPGLLAIYHLSDDKLGKEVLTGSKGLTLNATLYGDYIISPNQGLQLSVGVPLLVRKLRPDGLTRAFVLAMQYNFAF